MYKPPVIAFDFESNSLDYWSPDFRVYSCAFAWRDENGEVKTRVLTSPGGIKDQLRVIQEHEIPLVCHNAGFEYGVTKFVFPGYEDLIQFDTMRLSQVFDNGGSDDEDRGRFGLSKCVQRILQQDDHKAKYYQWLRDNLGIKAGQEKKNLSKLPEDLLYKYNAEDAIVTLYLYEKTTSEFEKVKYNWQLDHMLYMNITKHISMAKARGIAVDFNKLMEYQAEITHEIEEIDRKFNEYFDKFIQEIEEEKKHKWVNGVKTERGRQNRLDKLDTNPDVWKFKPKSKNDLKALLVDKQKVEPTFTTPKGSPSFKAAHIHTYGEGGKILATRNKRLLVLKQTTSLLQLASTDLRYHPDLKPTGTKTGRMAGGEVE
jgi:DNA polymerase I-like protein with 3'-5' exonuclease and polymerase domains